MLKQAALEFVAVLVVATVVSVEDEFTDHFPIGTGRPVAIEEVHFALDRKRY